MPGKSNVQYGNETLNALLYLPVVPYPTIASATTATTTLTVPGALPGDILSWNQQSYVATLSLNNMYVSAANTVSIAWSCTAAISTGNVALLLEVVRTTDAAALGIAGLPSAIV